MTLDLSIFKNKPIKSTASPLDYSAFQKTPIKSTATPLDMSAFQTNIAPKPIPKPTIKPITKLEPVSYKVPERIPTARQDFKDVANIAIWAGTIVPFSILRTAITIGEIKTGKAQGRADFPLFKGQSLVIQGAQQNYEERIKAGESSRGALIGSLLDMNFDLAFTLGAMKAVARKAVLKTPEKLVSRQVIADTQTVRNYVAGRSNYLGVEVPTELKTAWSGLSSSQKKDVLSGITSLEKVVPNRLAKILGVSEAEIIKLVPKNRIIAEERRLPGYAPEGKPAFGLSIEKRKPVGFGKVENKLKTQIEKSKTFKEFKNYVYDDLLVNVPVKLSKIDEQIYNKIGDYDYLEKLYKTEKGIVSKITDDKSRIKQIEAKILEHKTDIDKIEKQEIKSSPQILSSKVRVLRNYEKELEELKPTPQPTTLIQEAKKYKSADIKRFFDENYDKLSKSDQDNFNKIIYGMRGEYTGKAILLPKEQKFIDRIISEETPKPKIITRKSALKGGDIFPSFDEYYSFFGGAKAQTEGMDMTGDYVKAVEDALLKKRTDLGFPTPTIIEETKRIIKTHSLHREADLIKLKEIYNKAKGVSISKSESKISQKEKQLLSPQPKKVEVSKDDFVPEVPLKKTIPQQNKLHKSLTENGRVLLDDKGKQVFPKPIKENPTPLENPIIQEAKSGLKEEKELKKVENALAGVSKKHGQTEIIIESLKKKGVSQEQINNIYLENGDKLVDTVKVKREPNGVLSATIRKDTLQEMESGFTLDLADKKWIPTKTAMQKTKEGVKGGKETALIYYELPQIFHDRTGLRDYFYDPVREAERNADKMKTAIYNEFERAGLLNRGSWVTAERFAISKTEAKNIGEYYLTRQGKGGNVELSDLNPKEKKFVKTFDNVIKESEERFYKVAELNGKSPGKVENYAPIMTNKDYKLAQEIGDIDFIFRKHPAFFSLKKRVEDVPFDMYELDYRKIAGRWIDQMANFNHLGEVGVQTKYLANSDEFRGIVGDKVFNTTNKWLKDTFNPQVLSPAEKGGKIVRQATSIASLGLNMASVVKQYLSIIPLTIIEKAPPKLTSKFAKDFGIKVSELPSIRERRGNVSIMDMQNGLRKAFVGPLTGADKQVAQLELNSLLDRNYKRLLKEGNSKDLSPEMQAQLIKQAQDTLDMWMGGMTRAQLPLAFRTELGKLLNMFIYPLTSQLNGFIYTVAKAKGFSKAEKFAEVMASMLAIAYMEQVITNLSPQWSDKKEMVWDTLSSLAGNIPLLSQAVFAIRTDQPITPSPILGSISRMFSQTSKYFDDSATAGDVAFAWGELFGLPKGIRRATEGAELVREDGVRDKNGKLLAPVKGTWEQIRGFLRGKYGTIATQDWIRNIGVKTEDRMWFVPEVEFLQNGDYDRKEELYNLFDKETQDELYNELSEGQQKKLDKALREPPKTLEHKKRLFREKIQKALENGTMTQEEALEKTQQFKQAIEKLSK